MALYYLAAGVFWLVFGLIYTHFSHGVRSPFMTFAFLIPLAMCAVPAVCFLIRGSRSYPGRYARSIYRWACACFSVGSVLRGVVDIFGTASRYPLIYLAAGIVLLTVSVIFYIAERVRR